MIRHHIMVVHYRQEVISLDTRYRKYKNRITVRIQRIGKIINKYLLMVSVLLFSWTETSWSISFLKRISNWLCNIHNYSVTSARQTVQCTLYVRQTTSIYARIRGRPSGRQACSVLKPNNLFSLCTLTYIHTIFMSKIVLIIELEADLYVNVYILVIFM